MEVFSAVSVSSGSNLVNSAVLTLKPKLDARVLCYSKYVALASAMETTRNLETPGRVWGFEAGGLILPRLL